MSFDRYERAEDLRLRVAVLRGDARYWRRKGRRRTAVEIERVAAFIARLADDLGRSR